MDELNDKVNYLNKDVLKSQRTYGIYVIYKTNLLSIYCLTSSLISLEL